MTAAAGPAPYLRRPHFYETDQMGIIHHANYVHWFEEARVDFMEQMGYGYEKALKAGIDFAVLGVNCEYHAMVRFGQAVHIAVTITQLSPARMTVGYRVTDAESGTLCTSGESRHCYIDRERGRPLSLKKALPDLYAAFDALRCGELAEDKPCAKKQ